MKCNVLFGDSDLISNIKLAGLVELSIFGPSFCKCTSARTEATSSCSCEDYLRNYDPALSFALPVYGQVLVDIVNCPLVWAKLTQTSTNGNII